MLKILRNFDTKKEDIVQTPSPISVLLKKLTVFCTSLV